MAFASFDILAGIIPAFLTMRGRFDRLTIHDGGTWLGMFAGRNAGKFTHAIEYLIPDTAAGPLQVIVVDMAIIGKVMRQHFPLATSFVKIEDRIGDLSNIDRARPSW